MKDLDKTILNAMQEHFTSDSFLPLHTPIFSGNEEQYLIDCVRSNFVSSVGEYVDRFEKMLAEYTNAKYAISCVNGTSALHVCLILAGVLRDDEVLIPTMSFVATANAVSYTGALPHFVDSDESNLGINTSKLAEYLKEVVEMREGESYNRKTGRRIKAIVPMHTFGHPVDMDELNRLASLYHIAVIEDAAESLGSFYKGTHTGNSGMLSALSFNGNKIITTGGGGAILTNSAELAKRAKHITTTGKVPHNWEFKHDIIAYNYRMPALNGALGCAQMEQLPGFVEKKRSLAENYKKIFSDIEGVRFFVEPEYAKSNYWLNALILDRGNESWRDSILEKTNSSGIMTRPVWTLLHKLSMYETCPRMDLTIADSLEKRIINIPSSAWLSPGEA